MALTTVPESLVLKAWAKTTWEAAMNNIFFSKFTGTSADSIIQVITDLKKDHSGDTVIVPLLMKLKNDPIYGDNILEGNEEQLVYRDFAVTIDQVRQAVRLKGRMEEKKTQLDLRKDAKTALTTWFTEYIDTQIFKALTEDPTSDRIVYAGTATAEDEIAAADTMTTALIGKAKRLAMTDQNARIRPIMIEGGKYYVMVIDPWQARDLKLDPVWVAAQQMAADRGKNNPIFTGALGLFDGVVIHENDQVIRTETGASDAKVGHALFMGAQACAFANGSEPRWEEDDFDYHNQAGFSVGRIFGIKKTKFKLDGINDTDFGCINVLTSSIDD